MAGPGSGGRPRIGAQPIPEVFHPVGLAGGIDTKTDYKLVKDPKTLQALNVRYGTAGSVRKRLGISQLGALTGCVTALSTHTELLACNNANMYAVDVGTGALTSRGLVGASALVSNTLLSLGNLPTQNIRTIQLDYLTVGGVNYGLLAYDYAPIAALPNSGYGGIEVGSGITLVLFNANTNSTIWTTTTSGVYNSATFPAKLINAVGPTTTFNYSGGLTPVGAAFPVVQAYKGQFIVSWVSAQPGNTVTDNGTTLSGMMFTCQTLAFAPSAAIPIFSYGVNPPATICGPSPALIVGQPSAGSAYAPALACPLYFDLRTNGSDVLLYAAGQNYSAYAGAAPTAYRTPGAIALFSNAATFASPNVAAFSSIAPGSAYAALTIAPSSAFYAVVFASGGSIQTFLPNYTATPTLTASNNTSGATGSFGVPLTAAITTVGANFYITATDGCFYYNYGMANIISGSLTLAFPSGTSGGTVSMDCASPNYSQSGQLGSRFTVLNSLPAAWIGLSNILRSTLSSIALMSISNPAAIQQTQAIAHAAYLRYATQGVPNDPATPLGVSPFPRQACNIVTNPVTGNSTIAYCSNTNTQENVVSIRTAEYAFDATGAARQWVRAPQGILYLGADPKYYDGNTCRTMGWLKIPEFGLGNSGVVVSTVVGNYPANMYGAGGGLTPGGTYTFFFVYVDYDAQGNTIYGSPSPGYQVTVPSAANKYVLFIPSYMVPSRGYLQVYRNTVSNPLSYVKTRQFSTANVLTLAAGYTGVVDDTGNGASTETLAGGLLYAPPSGGELANDPPPASSMGVATKQRIFLGSQENPTWVYFSKPFFPGRAPEFNAGQFLDIDPTNGPNTGIAALDSTIVVFKKRHIYSFSGDGPDATGNGAFTTTIQIASDTGCQDTNSLLTTQDGVWFRSSRGLQMLTRGGQVIYPAAEVEGLLAGTTVVSSAIVGAQNQLRFALANGNVLVYDYLLQAWSVFVYFRPGAATTSPPTSLTILNGKVYTGNAAGDLCVEGTGFQDGTNNLPMTVQSAWINVAGPQGWGRIRRVAALGDFRSAHTLTMSFSYDFASTPAYSIPYTPSTTTQQNPYSWRVRAPRQVCQAVQITLTDNAPAGEGAVLTGLVLELGPKSQALRVPDTQSV